MNTADLTIKSLGYYPSNPTPNTEVLQRLYISNQQSTYAEIGKIVEEKFSQIQPSFGEYNFSNKKLNLFYQQRGEARTRSYAFDNASQYEQLIIAMQGSTSRELTLYDDIQDDDIQARVYLLLPTKELEATKEPQLPIAQSRSLSSTVCLRNSLFISGIIFAIFMTQISNAQLSPLNFSASTPFINPSRFQYYPAEPFLEALRKALNP
jgi:hypothetical protein